MNLYGRESRWGRRLNWWEYILRYLTKKRWR